VIAIPLCRGAGARRSPDESLGNPNNLGDVPAEPAVVALGGEVLAGVRRQTRCPSKVGPDNGEHILARDHFSGRCRRGRSWSAEYPGSLSGDDRTFCGCVVYHSSPFPGLAARFYELPAGLRFSPWILRAAPMIRASVNRLRCPQPGRRCTGPHRARSSCLQRSRLSYRVRPA